MYLVDDAGAVTGPYSASALSNPMTTAEDIIVGGASGTPARLGVGSEGDVLTVSSSAVAWAAASGGGVAAGTSMPGSPSAGDLFWRTDENILYTYDGTRWVSATLYETPFVGNNIDPSISTSDVYGRLALHNGHSIYVEAVLCSIYVGATNSGSNVYTYVINKIDTSNSDTSIGSIATTALGTTNWSQQVITVNATLDPASYPSLKVTATKGGSASNQFFYALVRYRIIGT